MAVALNDFGTVNRGSAVVLLCRLAAWTYSGLDTKRTINTLPPRHCNISPGNYSYRNCKYIECEVQYRVPLSAFSLTRDDETTRSNYDIQPSQSHGSSALSSLYPNDILTATNHWS